MDIELPVQAVIAAATVIAALITAMIATVNLTLSKEQKISEMRQAWIDGLREDLAVFFSSARFAAISREPVLVDQEETDADIDKRSELVAEHRAEVIAAFYKIRLRLNIRKGSDSIGRGSEIEHEELERLLQAVVTSYNAVVPVKKFVATIENAVTYARQEVLKKEWERVKSGEPPYRRLRNWVVPVTVGLVVLFAAFLYFVRFKA